MAFLEEFFVVIGDLTWGWSLQPLLVVLGIFITVLIAIIFVGAAAPAATSVFFFSDPMMGILAIVNLVAMMMLMPICLRILRDFRQQLASGIDRPVLNPDDYTDLDIDRTAWKPIAQTSE
ncbi:alanine:cation symporter family protein [Hoeflea sp. CAU 1731]